jgi:hypothetical protein
VLKKFVTEAKGSFNNCLTQPETLLERSIK